MMNKKIYVPLVVIAVGISAGVFGFDQINSNYDPFADSKYADSQSLESVNPYENYDDMKTINVSHSLYPDYSFKEIVDKSEIIVTGSIQSKEAIVEYILDNPEMPSVSTIYTVTLHSVMKGEPPQNTIRYTVFGGESENHISVDDGFVFEERDQVLLLLKEFSNDENGILYTPITLDGEYKVTNGGRDRGEVHRYGEDTTVPLPEFKKVIRSLL